jgi:hypothetical protein
MFGLNTFHYITCLSHAHSRFTGQSIVAVAAVVANLLNLMLHFCFLDLYLKNNVPAIPTFLSKNN